MPEDLRQATLEAIKRSGSVLDEVRQEKALIRETLRQSREIDEQYSLGKIAGFRIKPKTKH